MYKIHKLSKILSILLVVGVLGALALYTHTARSSALQNMSGYAWGGDWTDQNNNNNQDLNPNNVPYEPTGGVGWISFNCTTGGNCGPNDYGVNIETNGDLVGYAWSSNYGWLKFGGLSGQIIDPDIYDGNGNLIHNGLEIPSTDAKLTNNNITGWARFCAGASDPNTCNGTIPNPLNGGWDGWVSLSGSNYGVTLNPSTGVLSGFAWGGNDGGKNVVGWINFSTDFSDVIYEPVVGPTVSLVVESNSIPTGGKVELSWTGANLINSSTGCEATGGIAGDEWVALRTSPTGNYTTPNLPLNITGDFTYSIKCMGTNGEWSPVSSVIVTVGVILDFYAEPSPVYSNNGYETVLHWAVSPSTGDLHNCQASSTTPGENEWSGANIDDPTPSASFGPVYVPADPTNFTITCQNQINQNVVESILVYREELPASVDLWNSEVNCTNGLCTTTLLWEVVNADTCEAISIPAVPPTNWGGPIQTSPNAGNQPGVIVPLAPLTTTYRLECEMDFGPDLSDEVQLNSDSGANQPPIYQEN